MRFSFDAFVTEALFDGEKAAFALGDGRVVWSDGATVVAHEDGAALCAAQHPCGDGVLTGGDDGRLVWSRPARVDVVAEAPGAWIDAVATSPVSGLIALAAGKRVEVRDSGAPAFARRFDHPASVAGLAFDPKGRRLAAATYGGAALWWAKIADQKPALMRWAGSHVAAAFSPDGRFLVSAMQENALHGWRLADGRDMRMGGYPAKAKSLAFLDRGAWLATSGAHGVVLWPFSGAEGPMGRQALQIGVDESALVTRVAGEGTWLAAGLDDGRVWVCDLATEVMTQIREERGAPVSALAVSGRTVVFGGEAGEAGVFTPPG